MSISAYVIGNLTRDPELRQVNTANGPVKVCNFTVACSDRSLPRNSDGTPHTEFVRVAAWRGLADICQQYLKKGRKVKIEGAFVQHMHTGNDGVQRASIEFPNVRDVEMLDSARTQDTVPAQQMATVPQQGSAPAQQVAAAAPVTNYDAPVASAFTEVDDDELPF